MGGLGMNWLLIVVLAVLVVNALIGLKAGFIKTVFSICSIIVALILTLWISPTVNKVLRNNDKFYEFVNEKVEKTLPIEDAKAEATAEQDTYINKLPLPKSLKEMLIKNNTVDVYSSLAIDSFKDYISNYLTSVIINALAFIITFIILLIALMILCIVLNLISKLPILNQINKTAGLAAGLVQGLITVWILFILLTVFGGSAFGQNAFKMIEESKVLSIIYDNNLLLGFVTNASKIFF